MTYLLAGIGAVFLLYLALRRLSPRPMDPRRTAMFYRAAPSSTLAGSAPDFAYIDAFLDRWDRFANGANELMPGIQADTGRFNAELVRALELAPKEAMARAVMYPLLQVGGFVPGDSALGISLGRTAGPNGLTPTTIAGNEGYFAGDIFHWWEHSMASYSGLKLYDDWLARPFAQNTVIPMYRAARATA